MDKKGDRDIFDKRFRKPDRFVLIYVVAGFVWIFLSGFLVHFFANGGVSQTILELTKGSAFIIITAVILQLLISNYMRTIERQVKKLDDANRDLNTFIYKASHDLRGPITSTLGLARLAMDEIEDKEARWYFEKIYETTGKLDNILHNLISFISIRSNSISVEEIDLQRILTEITHKIDFSEMIKSSAIKVNIAPMDHFRSDEAIISVALQSIVENALQYTLNTGRDARINIRSTIDPSHNLQIEIEDNGVGIPDTVLPHVFHLLYRGNNESKGSGLGLYISKSLLDKINGKIYISSEFGQGTLVKVVIPDFGL